MKIVKKIDKYILAETLPFALIGFSFFTFIFILEELFRIFELILVRDVAFIKIIKLLAFLLPAFFGMTVPMGILIGVLLGISRLSYDTEIIALQANGVSILSFFKSVYLLSIIASIGMVIFNDRFIPYGNRQYKKIFYSILREKPTVNFKSRRLQQIGDHSIIPYSVNPKTGEMTGVYIYKNIKGGGRKLTIARRGEWIKNKINKKLIQLKLLNGTIIEPIEKKKMDQPLYKVLHTTFKEFILTINTAQKSTKTGTSISSREKYIPQLISEIAEIEKKYIDPKKYRCHYKWRDLKVELMKKFSIPFACFVFAFIGAPLGITSKRGGKGLGVGFSIIVIFTYYVLWYMGESFGKKNYIDVYTGGWLPDIVLFIAGIILNIKMIKK